MKKTICCIKKCEELDKIKQLMLLLDIIYKLINTLAKDFHSNPLKLCYVYYSLQRGSRYGCHDLKYYRPTPIK